MYFESTKGWTGLLVEPLPQMAALCRKNRRRSIVEKCAIVPFDFQGDAVQLRCCNLMSVVKGARKSEQDELEHIRKGSDVQKIEAVEITVPAATLTSLLDRHKVRKIDFFSLDVEGYELNVLQGLDFDRYRPDWLLIEARFRGEIDAYLDGRYETVAELSHHDVLYRARR